MPLAMASVGESSVIRKIGGKGEKRKFLEKLGFAVGGSVTVITKTEGSMIVGIKDARVAIGKEIANKIIVG